MRDKVEEAIEKIKANGFHLPSLKPGTRVLAESTIGTLYTLCVMDKDFVEFYSTDPIFQPFPPKFCFFVSSWTQKKNGIVIPEWVAKGCRMLFKFADGHFLTEPVETARLEGPGWHYEVIT